MHRIIRKIKNSFKSQSNDLKKKNNVLKPRLLLDFSNEDIKKIEKGSLKFNNKFEVFDSQLYLELNPDVKNAISAGQFKTAFDHFKNFGYSEILEGKRKWNKTFFSKELVSNDIEVSIICRTYNHEKYIKKALDGFLMQKTKFKYEVLIGDDVSSDLTVSIIEDYCKNYPDIFKLFNNKKNIGPVLNLANLSKNVSGKFVAMCEGDDHWIDEYKLQKQANFLLNNPEYNICSHHVAINYVDEDKRNIIEPTGKKETTTFDDLIKGNYLYMTSIMYRWQFPKGLNENNFNLKAMPADWQLHLHHAKTGKIKILNDVMGVYNRSNTGIWADSGDQVMLHTKYGQQEIEFFETFKKHNNGQYHQFLEGKQKYIFRLLANYYISIMDFKSLYKLICNNKLLYKDIFTLFGYDLSKINLSNVSSFKKSLTKETCVNVILTSYNHETYIEEALDSILAQKGMFTLKIIIGDDFSQDNTYKILKRYKLKHPGKIILLPSDKNVGVRLNLKRCFEECTGKYVAICEGDDYWLSPNKLEKQISVLRNNPDCSMTFNWLMLFREEKGEFKPHPQQEKYSKTKLSFEDIVKQPIIGNFSACMYRNTTIKNIPEKYFTDPIAFDWLFNVLSTNSGNLYFIKELLSVYRIHSKGLWSSNSKNLMQEKIRKTQQNFFNYYDHIPSIRNMNKINLDNIDKLKIKNGNKLKFNIDKFYIIAEKICIDGWLILEEVFDSLNYTNKIFTIIDTKTKEIVFATHLHETRRNDVVKFFKDTYKIDNYCGFSDSFLIELNQNKTYTFALNFIDGNNLYCHEINKLMFFKENTWQLMN